MLKSFLCVAALAVTATAAHAETSTIKTDDLDLGSAAGMKKLDQRIMATARRLCSSAEINTGTRLEHKSSAECVKRTVAQAREKLATLGPETSG